MSNSISFAILYTIGFLFYIDITPSCNYSMLKWLSISFKIGYNHVKKKLNLKCQNVTKNISKILEIWKKKNKNL